MTSEVIYEGGLHTTLTHLRSGSAVETDAPVDNNGKGERFSPTDLMATSLATCMVTIMAMKAESMDIELKGIRIEELKTMAADPRRISQIDLMYHIPEHLAKLDAKQTAIIKAAGRVCPVAKSIHPDIVVNIDWGAWS